MQILEEDDGSGWVKVLDDVGNRGLVPSTYLELSDNLASSNQSAPDVTEDLEPSKRPKGKSSIVKRRRRCLTSKPLSAQ